MVCEGKTCVPKGCTHNYQCAFAEECEKATGGCVPTPDDHCAVCDASAEGQCGGDPNLCVSLQDEDGNEMGDYCVLTCKDDPVDQCPQGWGCQHIQAQGQGGQPGLDDWFCVRSCWVDPVAP